MKYIPMITLLLGCIAGSTIQSMAPMTPELPIIPDASYFLYEGSVWPQVEYWDTKYVLFYTAEGETIRSVQNKESFDAMKRKLDKHAPKPQVRSYEIIFIPPSPLAHTKGPSGWLVLFYNSSDNCIVHCSYDPKKSALSYPDVDSLYDTSGQFRETTIEQMKDVIRFLDLSNAEDRTEPSERERLQYAQEE